MDPSDPTTEGYVKLGELTTGEQTFTIPKWPSEIMFYAKNLDNGSATYDGSVYITINNDRNNNATIDFLTTNSQSSSSLDYAKRKLVFETAIRNNSLDKAIYSNTYLSISSSAIVTPEIYTRWFTTTFTAKASRLLGGSIEVYYKI